MMRSAYDGPFKLYHNLLPKYPNEATSMTMNAICGPSIFVFDLKQNKMYYKRSISHVLSMVKISLDIRIVINC